MSDIFREIDEEIRRDKANELWKKHGPKFIAAALLFIASVAGWQFWQSQQLKQRNAAGAAFEAAIAEANSDKPEAQASLAALSAGRSGPYPALSRIRLASEMARTAKDDAARANAISAFDAIGADSALPSEWRELAKLRAGLLLVDTAPLAEIEKRLSPLISANGIFRHSAREGLALSAWKHKDNAKALDALQAIILDAETPQGLRQRAELLLAVVRAGPIR
ncbi:MAG: tetratricopeptide repeat protein [Methylobacterium sp.]|nr:tetratricopeptide repeat protein [Methylobacterium sp.]MCA3604518.1 tetratricopeptide repeat protein [Methylobacterium sp.]MCA3613965.1 tetratricopeptide repeat protein [Methylobacterium sp.]MCA3624257.1 tetratricopeptide repeat protein [Methylobacterium sp.]